LQTY